MYKAFTSSALIGFIWISLDHQYHLRTTQTHIKTYSKLINNIRNHFTERILLFVHERYRGWCISSVLASKNSIRPCDSVTYVVTKHRWSLRDNRTHRCLTCEVVHLHRIFYFINIQIYISLTQVGNKHGNVTRIASSKNILILIHYHPIGHELKLSPWIYIQYRGWRWCFICNVWVAEKASTIELGQLWKVKAIHGKSIRNIFAIQSNGQ